MLLGSRTGWRRVAPAGGLVCLTGLALVPLALAERANGKTSWIEGSSLLSRAGETVKEFLVGVYSPVEVLTALVAGVIVIAALAQLARADERERSLVRDAAIVAAAGVLIPFILAATRLLDVFDGRNVIAAWVPCAVVLAGGIVAARPRRLGIALGIALCALSLGVIAGVNLLPEYQRDDWRGAAAALPRGGPRVIVSDLNASLPLSIYLPHLRRVAPTTVLTREIDFIALRQRRTGRSPLAAFVPTTAPPGFRLAGYRRTATYAVSTFRSPRPLAVEIRALAELSEPSARPPQAEAMIQG